ncbi:MAG: dihydrofolate reductase [Bacteroidales bacterium]
MTEKQKQSGTVPVSLIAAVASNGAIGLGNNLLWHIPEDFRWFKKQTTGHTVVMGKRTWESLPVRPLPGRINIVLSDNPGDCFEGCLCAGSIEEAISLMDPGKENFIIGGGMIYRQFLPWAQKVYLTRIHRDYEADTWFPEIPESDWTEAFREDHPEGEPPYSFLIFERR